MARLSRPELRDVIRDFAGDHEPHARDLSAAIGALGGTPIMVPHVPAGLLELGVQMAGWPWDDRATPLAFASDEWQAREKHARAAARPHTPELTAPLEGAARDEARHHDWAFGALRELGCGPETAIGRATQAFARVHGATAETLEGFGRLSLETATRGWEAFGAVPSRMADRPAG